MQMRNAGTSVFCLFLFTAGGIARAASLNQTDKSFMMTAARIDMTEAHKGQMAETQAARTDVKDFARTLVQDHTRSFEHLSALAAKEGVKIPRGISGNSPGIAPLVHLTGGRFDRQFAREEVSADRQALAVFERESEHGRDADVKAYANSTIPALENDLRLAQQCAKGEEKLIRPHAGCRRNVISRK